jgi:nucleoid DNA-binding protein
MPTIEKNFDKSELVALTAAETSFDNDVVERILTAALNHLKTQVCQRGYAEIDNFGSFRIKEHAPLSGKTPTGDEFSVGKRLSIDFNAEKKFRDQLQTLTDTPVIA